MQKAEVRVQKAEVRSLKSEVKVSCLLNSNFCPLPYSYSLLLRCPRTGMSLALKFKSLKP